MSSQDAMILINFLADCRMASGDNGQRMQPEFVQYLKQLKVGHDRYEKLRRFTPEQFFDLYKQNLMSGVPFDTLVDEFGRGDDSTGCN